MPHKLTWVAALLANAQACWPACIAVRRSSHASGNVIVCDDADAAQQHGLWQGGGGVGLDEHAATGDMYR
jgi:hypothetical protein